MYLDESELDKVKNILSNPNKFVDEEYDIPLLMVNDTEIWLGIDSNNIIYFCVEDNYNTQDIYPSIEYPDLSLWDALLAILNKLE